MTQNKQVAGFSLIEVMVALTIISAGIIGTLSMIGANRALMSSTWDMSRMNMIADGVMNELAVRAHRGEAMPALGVYDWADDPAGVSILFTDNGYRGERLDAHAFGEYLAGWAGRCDASDTQPDRAHDDAQAVFFLVV